MYNFIKLENEDECVLFGFTQLYRQTDKNATRGTAKLDFLQECELMKCLQFLWCRGVNTAHYRII